MKRFFEGCEVDGGVGLEVYGLEFGLRPEIVVLGEVFGVLEVAFVGSRVG